MKTISWCLFEKIRDGEKDSGCSYIVMLPLGMLTCKSQPGKQVPAACGIDTGVKAGLQRPVSCTGVSLALMKRPSVAAIPG